MDSFPQILKPETPPEILSAWKEKMRERMPELDLSAQSPVVQAMEVLAADTSYRIAAVNAAAQQLYLPTASGKYLDALAARYGIQRGGRDDAALRVAVMEAPTNLSGCGNRASFVRVAMAAAERAQPGAVVRAAAYAATNSAGEVTPGAVRVALVGAGDLQSASSRQGAAAVKSVEEAVAEALERFRPIGVSVDVVWAEPAPVALVVPVKLEPLASSAQVAREAMARLVAMFQRSGEVGQSIALSSVVAAVHVPGVAEVKMGDIKGAEGLTVPTPESYLVLDEENSRVVAR